MAKQGKGKRAVAEKESTTEGAALEKEAAVDAPESGASNVRAEGPLDGPALRQFRESKGISLKEISDRTKINATILAALEDERFQDVPGARVYVRGFVRCLAREIGLDGDEVARAIVQRWESWAENRAER